MVALTLKLKKVVTFTDITGSSTGGVGFESGITPSYVKSLTETERVGYERTKTIFPILTKTTTYPPQYLCLHCNIVVGDEDVGQAYNPQGYSRPSGNTGNGIGYGWEEIGLPSRCRALWDARAIYTNGEFAYTGGDMWMDNKDYGNEDVFVNIWKSYDTITHWLEGGTLHSVLGLYYGNIWCADRFALLQMMVSYTQFAKDVVINPKFCIAYGSFATGSVPHFVTQTAQDQGVFTYQPNSGNISYRQVTHRANLGSSFAEVRQRADVWYFVNPPGEEGNCLPLKSYTATGTETTCTYTIQDSDVPTLDTLEGCMRMFDLNDSTTANSFVTLLVRYCILPDDVDPKKPRVMMMYETGGGGDALRRRQRKAISLKYATQYQDSASNASTFATSPAYFSIREQVYSTVSTSWCVGSHRRSSICRCVARKENTDYKLIMRRWKVLGLNQVPIKCMYPPCKKAERATHLNDLTGFEGACSHIHFPRCWNQINIVDAKDVDIASGARIKQINKCSQTTVTTNGGNAKLAGKFVTALKKVKENTKLIARWRKADLAASKVQESQIVALGVQMKAQMKAQAKLAAELNGTPYERGKAVLKRIRDGTAYGKDSIPYWIAFIIITLAVWGLCASISSKASSRVEHDEIETELDNLKHSDSEHSTESADDVGQLVSLAVKSTFVSVFASASLVLANSALSLMLRVPTLESVIPKTPQFVKITTTSECDPIGMSLTYTLVYMDKISDAYTLNEKTFLSPSARKAWEATDYFYEVPTSFASAQTPLGAGAFRCKLISGSTVQLQYAAKTSHSPAHEFGYKFSGICTAKRDQSTRSQKRSKVSEVSDVSYFTLEELEIAKDDQSFTCYIRATTATPNRNYLTYRQRGSFSYDQSNSRYNYVSLESKQVANQCGKWRITLMSAVNDAMAAHTHAKPSR